MSDILSKLRIQDISKRNTDKYYKFVVYGRFGTGKTTALTRESNALILDINEDGTTVTEDGAVVEIKNFEHLQYVINNLPQVLEALREQGKQIDIVVIETLQKLRDITMDDIMKGKSSKPSFNDWGAAATRIVSMYRLIGKLQQKHKFHFAVTAHESLNTEQDTDGATLNPTVTIEAQEQIKKAVVSQSDVLARTLIEVTEQNGEKDFKYIFSVEPSDLFLSLIHI